MTLVAEQHASVAQAGFLMAAFGVATIPSRLLGGRLADRCGARSTIAGGLVATAVAQLMVAGAQSLAQATVAVVLLGLAFEVYEPPSQSLVADATTAEDRPVAFGLLFAALSAAGMGAGILAALLAGVDLRWLFVADAATGLACAAVVWRRLPSGTAAAPPSPGHRARPWQDRRLWVLLGLGTAFAAVYLQVVITLPLTVTARGLPVTVVGVLLTVSARDRGARPTRHARGPAAPPGRPGRARGRLRGPRDRPAADGTRLDGAGVRRGHRRVERGRRAADGSRLHPRLGDRAGPWSRRVPGGVRHQLGHRGRPRSRWPAPSC